MKKKRGLLGFFLAIAMMLTGCASTPQAGAVQLDSGGTLPSEILSYLNENELKDVEAKFLVIQGGVQVSNGFFGLLGYSTVNTAILVTVGKNYRIAQMSHYIRPNPQNGIPAGQHEKLESISIVPNMVTKYNTLQEAQLASEMGA